MLIWNAVKEGDDFSLLELLGSKSIAEITADDLQTVMLKHLNTRATTAGGTRPSNRLIKPVTARSRMKTLITVFNWAKKKGILKAVPSYPDLPPAYYEHIVPPSESEMQRLLEVSPELLQRAIIIGARCGVRVGKSELLKLLGARRL